MNESGLSMPTCTPNLMSLARLAVDEFDVSATLIEYVSDSDNDVFRVETGDGCYALRLMWPEDNDVAAVESETDWLRAISAETDIVVPRPVPDRQGRLVIEIDDPEQGERRPCTLLEWVEGDIVDADLTTAHLFEVGALLGKLHEHAHTRAVDLALDPRRRAFKADLRYLLADASGRAAKWFDTATLTKVDVAASLIETQIGRLRSTPSTDYGFIHGDLHHWNYLFQGERIRAIDFSDAGWGHFVYDFAVTLCALKYPLPGLHDHGDELPLLQAALVEGYRSVRELPELWLEVLPAYETARLLLLTEVVLEYWYTPEDPDWGRPFLEVVPPAIHAFVDGVRPPGSRT